MEAKMQLLIMHNSRSVNLYTLDAAASFWIMWEIMYGSVNAFQRRELRGFFEIAAKESTYNPRVTSSDGVPGCKISR